MKEQQHPETSQLDAERNLIHGFLYYYIGDFIRYLNNQGLDPIEIEMLIANIEVQQ